MVKILVITGFGINCEQETAAAYRKAGAEPYIVHFNELLHKNVPLANFDLVHFPGGFSFGDDIASGKVMANKIKYKEMTGGGTFIDRLEEFVEKKGYIMGICNGFQMLVQLGLLPHTESHSSQEVALEANNSLKYEDRWVCCKVNPENTSPFLKGIDFLSLPVRHGEGRVCIKDDVVRKKIKEKNLIALQYVDEDQQVTQEYPYNPNGAEMAIAGLTDATGRIFGLMPHPEAFLFPENHPQWTNQKVEGKSIPFGNTGLSIFDNIVNHIKDQKKQNS